MWPFKKKPDLWRESVETRFVDLTDRCERLAIELGQRAIGTHTHPLEEHSHELPTDFWEHTHPEVSAPIPSGERPDLPLRSENVPHIVGPRLEGRVTCKSCGASYDLQEDCHIGNARIATVVCSSCGCQMEVDSASK